MANVGAASPPDGRPGRFLYRLDQHDLFVAPHDPDQVIWRYFDLAKFLSLVHRKALFLCRADLLGDPYEGSITAANREFWKSQTPASAASDPQLLEKYRLWFRKNVAINCWHQNARESAALWKLYATGGPGIAVKTTYQSLCNSIRRRERPEAEGAIPVYVGVVRYIDYESEFMPAGNLFYPFLHKLRSFEHERELRVVATKMPADGPERDLESTSFPEGGDYLPVDVDELLEEVYLAPDTPNWFVSVVESTLRKFGHRPVIRDSVQRRPPIY